MKNILILLAVLLCFQSFAHDTDKAYFKIYQDGETIEVVAEFPWTIRNAVLDFAPQLKSSNSKEEFDTAFHHYIAKNLILSDMHDNHLKLIEISKAEVSGHSHQNDYKLIFEGTTVSSITNTIMFNTNSTQENIHEFQYHNSTLKFTTDAQENTYTIQHQSKRFSYLWLIALVPLLYIIPKKLYSK